MPSHKHLVGLSILALLAACADNSPQASKESAIATADTAPRPFTAQASPEPIPISQPAPAPEPMPYSEDAIASVAKARPGAARSNEMLAAQFDGASRRIAPGIWHPGPQQEADREYYAPFEQNGVHQVSSQPVSTFSIDVDTAAYSNIRRMLQKEGRLPPAHAVRIEEMINYFDYQYPQPEVGQAFSLKTELADSPWHKERQLLQIGLQGYQPPTEQRPDANLVFLIDVSGSMRSPDKLGLLKKSLRLLVNKLDEDDRVAIVVYAGAAGLVLESTPASEKSRILQAIDGLTAGGSTHGSAGIQLAYQQAREHFIKDGINRVLIASDGDMNVGTVDIDALKQLIAKKRETGISLSTLGFGTGNYNYSLMEQLADNGNGKASYIDTLQEAHKVLVTEIQASLQTIARDVKIQIEFNPAYVAEYRLIGYENRLLKQEDFKNDKVDAGDIGAGHRVTALYEITPASAEHRQIDKLRYGKATGAATATDANGELAYVRLRYKPAGQSKSVEQTSVLHAGDAAPLAQASNSLRFAASVAGFGALLSGGKYSAEWGYNDALALARSARGEDPHGYRGEFIQLLELAQSLGNST